MGILPRTATKTRQTEKKRIGFAYVYVLMTHFESTSTQ